MSVLGLIVEYNPFHNGHLYHFNTSLDITQAEYSICTISGNFVQRGEPAIVNKWARTRMALQAGIDLVIELPAVYCVQSAELFAYGAVTLLDRLNIVDTLSFGSECADIELLKNVVSVLNDEPEEFKQYIRENLDEGRSFATSRAKSLIKYMKGKLNQDIDDEEFERILLSSNNILGIEYIKWLQRLGSSIVPVTLKRIHSKYNDISLKTPTVSATAIRKAVHGSMYERLLDFIPGYAVDIMTDEFRLGKGPVFPESFSQTILCMLRNMSIDEISQIMDVNEGLEYKIKKAARMSCSLDEMITNIKSKRYTETRIKRILIHSLLSMKKHSLEQYNNAGGPQYVRVLGFSEKGKCLLSKIKETCSLPIITNTADFRKFNNPVLRSMIEQDILSTDIYVTAYDKDSLRYGGYDFYMKPVML
jgi:Predicted nucleotidyltransferase